LACFIADGENVSGQLAFSANLTISVAYFAIFGAIIIPMTRVGKLRSNRLASATALIFLSCAVGHGFHALAALFAITGPDHQMDSMVSGWSLWPSATWDVLTAAVAIYYWTLRRGYGVLLGPGALFNQPGMPERLQEIKMREQAAVNRAAAKAERDAHAQMLRSVIANSQSLIYVKDLDGRYLLANASFERAFSVREAALLGQTDDYLDPELAPMWRANDRLAEKGACRVEEFSVGPDGTHHYEAVKFPLFDAAGQLYAICGVSLDITKLRRVTKDAERSRDEALAQTQVKSQFLATMSHEIRTPMNGVIGLADLLVGSDLEPAQHRYAMGIHTAGNALLTVINDILDFSKIEAGKLVLDEDDFDLPAMLADVAELAGPAADHKGLTLVTRRGRALPMLVYGDAGRVRQVMLNLTTNAVKFTANGSVTLRADRVDSDAAGSPDTETVTIRFEVTDTGIGVDPADIDRLFEPFAQADASTTRDFGGTGLGLAICRQIVHAMGGQIGIDSEQGQGSTFWCTIPLRLTAGAPALGGQPEIGGLRVLIVDSGPSRVALQERLLRWRMRPTVTQTADEAIRIMSAAAERGQPYDLTIIDADTPGIDATDLAKRIATDDHISAVHVITATDGPTLPPDVATAAGISAQLTKPIRQSTLYDCLAQAMATPPATIRRPESSGALTAVAHPDAALPAEAPAGQPRLLLVEDNDINQMVAVGILDRLGYSMDVANDGVEALDLAAERNYDAVLMDCQMPRMDGFTATGELRRLEGDRRHTPIIAMTANALVADRQRCLEAGMDDYISKPVTPAEVESVLRRWISDTSGARSDEARAAVAADPAEGEGGPIVRRLDELRGDGTPPERALITGIVKSFLTRAPGYLTTLADAARSGDANALAARSHSLKGAAANLGANGIAEICDRVETVARRGPLDDEDTSAATADLRLLDTEWQDVRARLEEILEQEHTVGQPDSASLPS
jgi:PAS domain S-box-containing protein